VQKSIDLPWLRERLPEAREMGVVFFDVMGLGEPTLLRDLPELLAVATALGMVVTVGTHGATPNLRDQAYRERLFAASPIKFRISLDSADPLEHDRARAGTPTWEHAVGFIERVVAAREAGRLRGAVFVNRVLTASNIGTLLRDLSFYAGLGVDDVQLIPIRFHTSEFLTTEQIRHFNAEVAPRIEELAARHRLPWLREIARPFGVDDDEIELASQGRYYRPTQAAECHIQKAQLLLDAQRQPCTCLWSRRNGGGPIPLWDEPPDELPLIRDRMLPVNYLQVNPFICESLCTRRIIHANNAAARAIDRLAAEDWADDPA
jgi:MoaA/NifB/PqqE/SkfB family radical SAM enzyme